MITLVVGVWCLVHLWWICCSGGGTLMSN